ncbi:M20/M25/M40 family metallo-hydrolase [Geodermatophilus sp. CPCC 205761]|uniref:M20/M25/M40 family metallo-hydrolase n=1 Tax=Geodermatophilus sp. CPCC 205761 TaxID=2936597 RepID=UPI003EE87374
MVLFDLGDTLESDGVLRPGALETLEELTGLCAGGRPAVVLGLLSDFRDAADPADVPEIVAEYHALLDELRIRRFFEPLSRRVTLSTEVGVRKPAPAVFRAAVAKAEPALAFSDVLFVTENAGHVRAARELGMAGVHLRPPGGTGGEVAELPDLVPLVRAFVEGTTGEDARGPAPDSAWTRLGDEVVVTGDAPPADAGEAPRAGRVHVHAADAAERLFLVTQNGRLFQTEHPDVPVLVDTGRNLVVDLEPAAAERLGTGDGVCWSMRPLPGGSVVVAAAPVLDRAPEERDEVRCLVDRLSRDGLTADLETLVGHPTRHSASDDFDTAASRAADQLQTAGYAVTTQPVPRGGGRCRNVIADRPGTGPEPRDVVLVTAHLDSVNRLGSQAPAPGADDNASGSAGVLALARVFGDSQAALDLRLVLFGGEEQGLFGSRRYVAELAGPERARIRAVVNMDMIAGRNTPAAGVLLEGAAVSQDVVDALARAAATYTGLAVSTSTSPANSDHVPFIDVGIPAVLTIEGADGTNARVHTEQDTLPALDTELAMEILRMNVAFVAETLAGGDGAGGDGPA